MVGMPAGGGQREHRAAGAGGFSTLNRRLSPIWPGCGETRPRGVALSRVTASSKVVAFSEARARIWRGIPSGRCTARILLTVLTIPSHSPRRYVRTGSRDRQAGKGKAHVQGYADDGAVFTQLREAVFIVRNDQLALCASPARWCSHPTSNVPDRRDSSVRTPHPLAPAARPPCPPAPARSAGTESCGCAHGWVCSVVFRAATVCQRRLPDFCLPGLTTKRARLLTDRKKRNLGLRLFSYCHYSLMFRIRVAKLLQTRIAAGRRAAPQGEPSSAMVPPSIKINREATSLAKANSWVTITIVMPSSAQRAHDL